MAATTAIAVFHGSGSGTEHRLDTTDAFVNTIGTIRYKQADDSNVDTANPIPIPTSGAKYSFLKHTKIKFLTAPPTQITNLRWFSDGLTVQPAGGSPGSGETVKVFSAAINATGAGGQASNGYLPSVPAHGDTDMLTAGNGYSGRSDGALRTSAAPLQLVGTGSTLSIADPVIRADGSDGSGGAAGAFPRYGNQPFVVAQMEVQSTATSGSTTPRTNSFRYDEA